jgi:hypothetical protein
MPRELTFTEAEGEQVFAAERRTSRVARAGSDDPTGSRHPCPTRRRWPMAAENQTEPGRLTLLARRSWGEYISERRKVLTELVEANFAASSTTTPADQVQLELELEDAA